MRLLPFLLLFGFSARGQSTDHKNLVIPQAKKLNDSAITIVMRTQDYEKAISLLDEATEIDSNYYRAYSNKLAFQLELKQFDKALATAKNLIRIKPQSPDYYITTGILYYQIGDTVSSQNFFIQA